MSWVELSVIRIWLAWWLRDPRPGGGLDETLRLPHTRPEADERNEVYGHSIRSFCQRSEFTLLISLYVG